MMRAVLSNAQHPENSQITVHFPILREGYDGQVEALEARGSGTPFGRTAMWSS